MSSWTVFRILIFLVLPCFMFPPPAYSYLDLAAGSYCMQILLASWMAVGFGVTKFWGRIIAPFRGAKKKTGESEQK